MEKMAMLEDVKILDFCTNVAGPGISGLASDYGAQVIKIESSTGDPCRNYQPYIDGYGMTHAWVNRGKRSIVLDLKDPRSIEICKKLVMEADILVESFRPGVMARLGLGYDEMHAINEKLVYCSLSYCGQTGPDAQLPGYDLLAQAKGGMISQNGLKGGRPMQHGVSMADYFAGINGWAACATALLYSRRTGHGQHVDVSLTQGMVYLCSPIDRAGQGILVKPNGWHHPAQAPFGCFFNDKGESVVICAHIGAPWQKLCKCMGREDLVTDPVLGDFKLRAKNQDQIVEIIEAWLNTFSGIDEAIAELKKYDVPLAKIQNPMEVINDPQIKHMGYVVEAPTPDYVTSAETYITRGPNACFSETPGITHKAPGLGEHTAQVLADLGYDEAFIESIVNDMKPSKLG